MQGLDLLHVDGGGGGGVAGRGHGLVSVEGGDYVVEHFGSSKRARLVESEQMIERVSS